MNDFRIELTVPKSPAAVLAAIADVRSWWGGTITGTADRVGAEFTYRYKDMHTSTQRVVEMSPERIVWDVLSSELTFLEAPKAWDGTRIVFALSPSGTGTKVVFTHEGLVPSCECYGACSEGWTYYVNGSLKNRLA